MKSHPHLLRCVRLTALGFFALNLVPFSRAQAQEPEQAPKTLEEAIDRLSQKLEKEAARVTDGRADNAVRSHAEHSFQVSDDDPDELLITYHRLETQWLPNGRPLQQSLLTLEYGFPIYKMKPAKFQTKVAPTTTNQEGVEDVTLRIVPVPRGSRELDQEEVLIRTHMILQRKTADGAKTTEADRETPAAEVTWQIKSGTLAREVAACMTQVVRLAAAQATAK